MADDFGKQTMKSSDVILYRLDEMQKTQERMVQKLDVMPRKEDLDRIRVDKETDHKTFELRITALESKWSNIVNRIAGVAIVAIVLMVLALYGLDKFVKL